MFEDIHSFLRSGHQSGEQEASESSCEENTGSSQLSGTMVGRDEVEQLFQNYIFQDSSFDRRRARDKEDCWLNSVEFGLTIFLRYFSTF